MGHSQGGLLTRLMVTESGSRFWDAASRVPFASLRTTAEERELLQPTLFFEPLPFVTRVVFLPRRTGSFEPAGRPQPRASIITLPLRLAGPSTT